MLDSLPLTPHEVLDADARELERVMLGVRTSEGVEIEGLPGLSLPEGTRGSSGGRIATLIADGLIDGACALSGRVVLTLRGRLLADYVTREIMGY